MRSWKGPLDYRLSASIFSRTIGELLRIGCYVIVMGAEKVTSKWHALGVDLGGDIIMAPCKEGRYQGREWQLHPLHAPSSADSGPSVHTAL